MAEQAMIHITMGAQSGDFASGTTAGQAIRAMLPAGQAERVLCAMQGGICVELSDPLTEDCALEPLTYRDEEGRRVYERSLPLSVPFEPQAPLSRQAGAHAQLRGLRPVPAPSGRRNRA